MAVFHKQIVLVYPCDPTSGKMMSESIAQGSNTIEAFEALWELIGEDETVRDAQRFHFKYFNEGKHITFKHNILAKHNVRFELDMNNKNNDSVYAEELPDFGKFIHYITNDDGSEEQVEVEEEELRRIVSRAIRPNLKLEEMVEVGTKFYTRKGYILFEVNVKHTQLDDEVDMYEVGSEVPEPLPA